MSQLTHDTQSKHLNYKLTLSYDEVLFFENYTCAEDYVFERFGVWVHVECERIESTFTKSGKVVARITWDVGAR